MKNEQKRRTVVVLLILGLLLMLFGVPTNNGFIFSIGFLMAVGGLSYSWISTGKFLPPKTNEPE